MKLVRTDGQWFAMVYDNFTTHDLDFFNGIIVQSVSIF